MMKKLLFILSFWLFGFLILPKVAFAQGPSYSNPLGCGGDPNALDTAIGCIPIGEPREFIAFVLRWAMGIGGGVAFLLILYSGFMMISSSGNPERLQAGRELLTAAISGIVLLIFSIFILRFVGIDILGISSFGT
jgi:hypothetical protein